MPANHRFRESWPGWPVYGPEIRCAKPEPSGFKIFEGLSVEPRVCGLVTEAFATW